MAYKCGGKMSIQTTPHNNLKMLDIRIMQAPANLSVFFMFLELMKAFDVATSNIVL